MSECNRCRSRYRCRQWDDGYWYCGTCRPWRHWRGDDTDYDHMENWHGQEFEDCSYGPHYGHHWRHGGCYSPKRVCDVCSNVHIKLYANRVEGVPPTDPEDYDGYADWRLDANRRIIVVPGRALTTSGGIGYSPDLTTYIAAIDDESGNPVAWFQVDDWSFTTAPLSNTTDAVDWVALAVIPAGIPKLVGPMGPAWPGILMESGAAAKISAMPVAGTIDGTELLPIVQTGVNDQLTIGDLFVAFLTLVPPLWASLQGHQGGYSSGTPVLDYTVPSSQPGQWIFHLKSVWEVTTALLGTLTLTLAWTDQQGNAQTKQWTLVATALTNYLHINEVFIAQNNSQITLTPTNSGGMTSVVAGSDNLSVFMGP